MTDLWTIDELVKATGGTLQGNTPAGCNGVTLDSREVKAGDLFFALAGEAADGHIFVPGAHLNGAALSIVSHPVEGAGAQLVVKDTTQALYDLATFARNRAPAKRAGVTGSVGKTGTTRAIETGLRAAGTAHGPVGSFNNHTGVPLTLTRMPRDTERAVFEMGMNHPNEITPLSQLVQPSVALITTVGSVHAEHFPAGEEGIARAKAEIFNGMKPGGIAILNRDNKWYDLLESEARNAGLKIQSFGTHESATARLTESKLLDDGIAVNAIINGTNLSFTVRQNGQHWAMNGLGVLLTLEAMDVSREVVLHTLDTFAPLAGRGASHTIPFSNGSIRLIDESYNANPISMKATIEFLGQQVPVSGGRKIAVLTDMLELGPNGANWHRELADVLDANKIDLVFCAGPLMQNLWDALPASRRGAYAPTAAELAPQLESQLAAGDVVLVKGSKGSKAAMLAETLLKLGNKAA